MITILREIIEIFLLINLYTVFSWASHAPFSLLINRKSLLYVLSARAFLQLSRKIFFQYVFQTSTACYMRVRVMSGKIRQSETLRLKENRSEVILDKILSMMIPINILKVTTTTRCANFLREFKPSSQLVFSKYLKTCG